MATLLGQPMDIGSDKHSIVDDFMYGSNVASSHVYIRLGICLLFIFRYYEIWTLFASVESSNNE